MLNNGSILLIINDIVISPSKTYIGINFPFNAFAFHFLNNIIKYDTKYVKHIIPKKSIAVPRASDK